MNMLEWLTELRETFCLLGWQFITKDITQKLTDGWGIQGKMGGKGMEFPNSLSVHHSANPYLFTNLEAFLNTVLSAFYEEVFIPKGMTD